MKEHRTTIETILVGQMRTNCYLCVSEHTATAVIVDPGDDPEYIVERVVRQKVRVLAILATHGHFDHVMGVPYLQSVFDVPFLMCQKDEFLLRTVNQIAALFLGSAPNIPQIIVDRFLIPGKTVAFDDILFEVVGVPGHTPGSVALYNRRQGYVFVGDTIFEQGGVGRTDFSYSDSHKLMTSVKRILALPTSTLILPGHGNSTSVASEKRHHDPTAPADAS